MRERNGMLYLSLFSGAGCGDLALQRIVGMRCVGYVEREEYAQRILAARIADGWLDSAPIFGDIDAFTGTGYADRYRGVADCVSGGFPCQPFSIAGKRAAAQDERNKWPAMCECIERVAPRYVFAENVPGLLSASGETEPRDDGLGIAAAKSFQPYAGAVFADLSRMGYRVEWGVIGADDISAPHRRKRLWIVGELADYNSR